MQAGHGKCFEGWSERAAAGRQSLHTATDHLPLYPGRSLPAPEKGEGRTRASVSKDDRGLWANVGSWSSARAKEENVMKGRRKLNISPGAFGVINSGDSGGGSRSKHIADRRHGGAGAASRSLNIER
ncbi:hypothetical protein EYF80_035737 [Liparis tanakae]|uniref:Uncharacterized protein n=1 Tax=Liparis tanakae TaxID=230148 RepID=A0A4Z2GKP4_9TELE|nr:hypothetical protein EYF80_035737 [Liparis tanakae]